MSAGNLDEAVFTLQVILEGVFPSGRKEGGGLPMVTYTELFQFCMLIVALVGLCYTIFHKSEK